MGVKSENVFDCGGSDPAGSFTDACRCRADDPLFGGQGRIDTAQTYFSQPDQGHYGVTAPHHLKLYLPARTAIVLLQERIRTIMDL